MVGCAGCGHVLPGLSGALRGPGWTTNWDSLEPERAATARSMSRLKNPGLALTVVLEGSAQCARPVCKPMEPSFNLPELPPWESPQFLRVKSKPSTSVGVLTGTSAVVSTSQHGSSTMYTPLNFKSGRNRIQKTRGAGSGSSSVPTFMQTAPAAPYDASPFLLHQSVFNNTKIEQFQQQESCMRKIFEQTRPVPDASTNTSYYQTLWRQEQDTIEAEMPSTPPGFDTSASPQSVYKQLRQFQSTFLQQESWKYDAQMPAHLHGPAR